MNNEENANVNDDKQIGVELDLIKEIIHNNQEQYQMIELLVKNQIQVKDEMINKLHMELEFYKQDSATRFIDQVMKDIIKIRMDMKRMLDSEKWAKMSAEQMKEEYRYIFEDITDLLEQQNIDAYETECGEIFNAKVHSAKIEITDDPRLDKTIKCSIREGYIKNDKVLLPEKVIVYQVK